MSPSTLLFLVVLVPGLVWLACSIAQIRRGVRAYRDVIRRHKQVCGTCGYDVSRTPDRCPECGTVPRWSP